MLLLDNEASAVDRAKQLAGKPAIEPNSLRAEPTVLSYNFGVILNSVNRFVRHQCEVCMLMRNSRFDSK